MAKASAIVELLTREHGRHLGLVRGGAGSRMRPLLQPGNSLSAVWRARLDEHLGTYAIEGLKLRAATLLGSSHGVYGVTHLASIARLLPERDPHEEIFALLEHSLDDFDDIGSAAVHVIHFELAMLSELGFGLALENCAVTGETTDLIYVSPKSGGAVSRARRRAMARPAVAAAAVPAPARGARRPHRPGSPGRFRLTGLFLLRHVLEPRGQGHSDARAGFINALTRQQARAAGSSAMSESRICIAK